MKNSFNQIKTKLVYFIVLVGAMLSLAFSVPTVTISSISYNFAVAAYNNQFLGMIFRIAGPPQAVTYFMARQYIYSDASERIKLMTTAEELREELMYLEGQASAAAQAVELLKTHLIQAQIMQAPQVASDTVPAPQVAEDVSEPQSLEIVEESQDEEQENY